MIDKARELAAEAGVLDKMEFAEGALEDLSAYRDGQFDLVLSFDAPVSYTYPHQDVYKRQSCSALWWLRQSQWYSLSS